MAGLPQITLTFIPTGRLLKDGALQVELEIRVDGGGGEEGEEVKQLAHHWNWTQGAKVITMEYADCDGERVAGEQVTHLVVDGVFAQEVIVSDANQGLAAAWRNAWRPKVTSE